MTLGIALILIFVLYLIDKHNRWRQAIKITVALIVLGILGIGGLFGWQEYETRRAAKQEAQREAEQAKRAAQEQSELAKTCKDWEDKHPIGSPPDKVYTERGGLTEKLTNKHFWILDPPQGCEGPLERDYYSRNVWIVVAPNPAKSKVQQGLGWAVVTTDYGLFSVVKRCAYDVGSFPCGYLDTTNGEIAHLNKGDRVQILSDKIRAPNGTEIYQIRFQQWTGWGDASGLSLEKGGEK
jgi:type II secretory pathway pseudopilin PulG